MTVQRDNRWIKDGFVTYGYSGWHFFPRKNHVSACAAVIAHQRGWEQSVDALPEGTSKLIVCGKCLAAAKKASLTETVQKPTVTTVKKCGKREYFGQAEADRAMLGIRTHDRTNTRHEIRSYYCNMCDSWHLTSKEKRK